MITSEKATVKDLKWQEEEALARYTLIAPLLDASLDPAKASQLRKQIATDAGISERTIYRYLESYNKKGFPGLKPVASERAISKKLPPNYREIVGQAIQLRREVPSRSVEQMIFILEQEGWAPPGTLKRPTLERYLFKAGFGATHMKVYKDARESSSKRFCKAHRMEQLQADLKYGPMLPIGKNGAKIRTYLSTIIDDHSRYVLFSRFYDNQKESVIEESFRMAILKAGAFDHAYVDNGKQYVAGQLRYSLAQLGIKIKHAPVRSGKSKGVVERFHRTVDAFVEEVKAHGIKTLEDLNRHWDNYLEEYYHKKPHAGIREYYESLGVSVPEEGITPLQEWNRDTRALTFIDTTVVAEAFRHHETRRVDKGACISFMGRRYETRPALIGKTVEISYDPSAPEDVTVHYEGMEPFVSKPLVMKPQCDPKPAVPAEMQKAQPDRSRMLDVLDKKSRESKEHMADAISFGSYRKEGGCNV